MCPKPQTPCWTGTQGNRHVGHGLNQEQSRRSRKARGWSQEEGALLLPEGSTADCTERPRGQMRAGQVGGAPLRKDKKGRA